MTVLYNLNVILCLLSVICSIKLVSNGLQAFYTWLARVRLHACQPLYETSLHWKHTYAYIRIGFSFHTDVCVHIAVMFHTDAVVKTHTG